MGIIGPADWAGSLVSAIFGILTILIAARLGRELAGEASGILAMGLLGFSGMHLIYSREGLAESDTAFFYVLSAYLLWKSGANSSTNSSVGPGAVEGFAAVGRAKLSRLALAGASGGAAFVCNFRSAGPLVVLLGLAVTAILVDRLPTRRERLARVAILLAGALLIPFLCEMVYSVLRALGHAREAPSYLEDLAYHFRQLSIASSMLESRAGDPRFLIGYLYALFLLDGPLHFALLVAGVVAYRRASFGRQVFVLAPAFVPLLAYGLFRGGGLRFISTSLPFLALVKAEGLLLLLRWAEKARRRSGNAISTLPAGRAALAALAVGVFSIPQLIEPLRVFSPDRRAVAEAFTLPGDGPVISTRYFMNEFYAPAGRLRYPPDSEWELYEMHQRGARYLISDHERFAGGYHGRVGDEGLAALIRTIRTTQTPTREAPNPFALSPQSLLEQTTRIDAYRSLREEILRDPDSRTVKVYDLARFFAAVPESVLRTRAIPEFRRRLSLGAQLNSGNRKNYLEKLAYLFAREGNGDAAIATYEDLIAIDPRSARARFNVALLYEVRGDWDRALSHYAAIIRLDPDDGESWRRMGNLLAQIGRTEEAARAFAEASRLDAESRR